MGMANLGGVSVRSLDLAVFEPFFAEPGSAALFTDFDGTISEIVDDPASATPVSGAVSALVELAGVFGRVGLVSGRPVSFLETFVGPPLVLAGLYGLETVVDGHRVDHPLGGSWREVIDDVASVSRARGPKGMRVESKGLSLTMHYRGSPEIESAVRRWCEQQGARSGLEVRPAKMSYEMHPPIDTDKGTALTLLADELQSVCFIGDDHGDLLAFDALDALRLQGRTTVRVGVRSNEASVELLERSDVIVDGPLGTLGLLHALVERSR